MWNIYVNWIATNVNTGMARLNKLACSDLINNF